MNFKGTSRIALVVLAAMTLQGCVAAAIPALAGAALVRTQTDGEDVSGDDAQGNGAAADTVAIPMPTQDAAEATIAPASAPTPEPELVAPPASLSAGNSDRIKAVIIGAAPPPSGEPTAATSPTKPLSGAFLQLITFAGDYVSANAPSGTLESAILKDPASLTPVREECTIYKPTILIDLDTETDGTGPITAPPNPALGQGLQSLRDKGVEIAWISERSAGQAGDIRLALKQSGIDPQARDTLLMMRYPGDRKQTRREELAKSACIIAIAGDSREDFDELYEYLVNPDAALALEELIGDGWFLVPSVLGEAE
ncbi:MAG: hypothetical protein AAF687_09580 [Pseudomonadota bacterium]